MDHTHLSVDRTDSASVEIQLTLDPGDTAQSGLLFKPVDGVDRPLEILFTRQALLVGALNFNDLTLPDKLTDLLRGRTSKPFFWKEVRAVWIAQMRHLSNPEGIEQLAARMIDLIEERIDRCCDLVWVAQEVCARSLACGGAHPDSVIHVAYGYGLFTGGLGLHYGAERLGALTVPASGGNTPRQITLMQDLGATVLCCTPSYALNVAETMRDRGIERSTLALEVGVFGAEPWTVGMREEIERALGLVALDIYGLSEVMGPGVSMESVEDRDGLFIWEDHFYPEVIDPVSGDVLPYGEEGELVFTSLTKRAFPVLRYRTGDLCTLFAEPTRSGRTMVRMTKVKGRTDDMLIVRGVNVFPSEIERVVLEQHELAPHYQIMLSRDGALDRLAVHVEVASEVWVTLGSTTDSDGARGLASRLRRELASTLSLTADVELGGPGTVPRSEGKAVRVVDRR